MILYPIFMLTKFIYSMIISVRSKGRLAKYLSNTVKVIILNIILSIIILIKGMTVDFQSVMSKEHEFDDVLSSIDFYTGIKRQDKVVELISKELNINVQLLLENETKIISNQQFKHTNTR